jgi:Recombination directionality factor-like
LEIIVDIGGLWNRIKSHAKEEFIIMIKNGISIRFTEVGKIKIGGKGEKRPTKDGKGSWQLPVRFNHFVVTTTEKGQDGNFLPDKTVMEKLGNTPKEIEIRLPFDSIDMNFWTSFRYYAGKKCVCHGDGEQATRLIKDVEQPIECNPRKCEYLQPDEKGATKCKPTGILSCYIPASMHTGIYRFRTHSWNSVSGILAALHDIKITTGGILRHRIPLKLKFIKKNTEEHGDVPVVTIVLNAETTQARNEARLEYKERMELGMDMKRIEAEAKALGFQQDLDDPEDVEAEYYGECDRPQIEVMSEPEKPGASADDVKKKLDEKVDKPEPKQAEEGQGSLI